MMQSLKVDFLKEALLRLRLPRGGLKADLQARLLAAMTAPATRAAADKAVADVYSLAHGPVRSPLAPPPLPPGGSLGGGGAKMLGSPLAGGSTAYRAATVRQPPQREAPAWRSRPLRARRCCPPAHASDARAPHVRRYGPQAPPAAPPSLLSFEERALAAARDADPFFVPVRCAARALPRLLRRSLALPWRHEVVMRARRPHAGLLTPGACACVRLRFAAPLRWRTRCRPHRCASCPASSRSTGRARRRR